MEITMKPETHLPDNHILVSGVTSVEAAEPVGKEGEPGFPCEG